MQILHLRRWELTEEAATAPRYFCAERFAQRVCRPKAAGRANKEQLKELKSRIACAILLPELLPGALLVVTWSSDLKVSNETKRLPNYATLP